MSHYRVSKRARMSFNRLRPALLGALLVGVTHPDFQSACDASYTWLRAHDGKHLKHSFNLFGPSLRYYHAAPTGLVHWPTPEHLKARLDRMLYLTQRRVT